MIPEAVLAVLPDSKEDALTLGGYSHSIVPKYFFIYCHGQDKAPAFQSPQIIDKMGLGYIYQAEQERP